jgi:hypothetical protein
MLFPGGEVAFAARSLGAGGVTAGYENQTAASRGGFDMSCTGGYDLHAYLTTRGRARERFVWNMRMRARDEHAPVVQTGR